MSIQLDLSPGSVIVAGGSGGIGAGICRRFAEAGAHVAFTYHSNESKAQQLKDEINAAGGSCSFAGVDLSQGDQVDKFIANTRQQHGHIASIIYAAGPHFDFNFIGTIPESEWKYVVNADINGAFNLVQAAVRCFRAQESEGNLLAVITAAVERVPTKDIMSAAPKAAIEMLIRGVAKESGRYGIRANCIGPGWINAGLGKIGIEEKLDEASRAKTRKAIPLQRFGEADDIAYAALFLCSKQAGFISGQSLAVDGGMQI
jgi:NAD(P)-dependent dehydrogenase (short-subunit alcohol dehydrogenase family)